VCTYEVLLHNRFNIDIQRFINALAISNPFSDLTYRVAKKVRLLFDSYTFRKSESINVDLLLTSAKRQSYSPRLYLFIC